MALTFVGIGISISLSVVFTLLAVTLEVSYKLRKGPEARTRWRTKACFTRSFRLYFVLLTTFNAAGTLLALTYMLRHYPEFSDDLGAWLYFMSAILGVFAFEVILANTDIIFFNKSVGIIQTWATWARDPAVAAATEKQARLDKELQQEIVRGLEDLSEPDLNTHLLNIVGREDLQKLEEEAQAENVSPKLYKALELVNRAPDEAVAILKQVRKSKQR